MRVLDCVEKVSDQYSTFLGNGFIRSAMASVEVPYQYRVAFDLLVLSNEGYRQDGYSFDDLYLGIIGLAHFVYLARTVVFPNLQKKVYRGGSSDNILERMATDNMLANLGALSDRVSELYVYVVDLDKRTNPRRPYQKSYPELQQVGQLLTSQTPGIIPN